MKKILLVEDDPFLINIYKKKLKDAGYLVFVAKDGRNVFEIMEKENPGLLLLDIVLPYTNGWEILEKIRDNEKFKNLKVVILSNLSQKEDVEKGEKLGADKFLVKAHYTPSEVVEEIKKLF